MTASDVRVLIVHNRYRFKGGEERIVALQKELLESKGHAVDLYEEDSAEFARRPAIARFLAAASMPFSRRHYSGLRERIRSFRPDIVHVHNVFPLLTPAIYLAAAAERVPLVQSVHNYRFLCSNGLFLLPSMEVCERCRGGAHWNAVRFGCYAGSRLKSLGMAITLLVHGRAFREIPAAFITPSEFLKGKLVAGGFPAERIHRLTPGFAPPSTPPATRPERTLLYVGRLSPEKGVSVLISAAVELPDWKIRIVGAGPEESELRKRAAGLGNVEFMGARPAEELPFLYRQSTALVLPSICYENLPSVILEAWRESAPVIVSRIGGMAELVEEGITGFQFGVGDARDLARAARLLTPQKAASMGPAIRSRYEKDFGAEAQYRKLTDVYRIALAQPTRRS